MVFHRAIETMDRVLRALLFFGICNAKFIKLQCRHLHLSRSKLMGGAPERTLLWKGRSSGVFFCVVKLEKNALNLVRDLGREPSITWV